MSFHPITFGNENLPDPYVYSYTPSHDEPPVLSKVENMHIPKVRRAGLIFYTIIKDKLYMCFGRDAKTYELTDFGGGRHQKESPIKTAVREGNEESRLVFGKITPESIGSFYGLYDKDMLIVFVPVVGPDNLIINCTSYNFHNKTHLTLQQKKNKAYNELSGIVWLDEEQLNHVFSEAPGYRMYDKVRKFFCMCEEFAQSAVIMKNILKTTTYVPGCLQNRAFVQITK